MTKRLVWPVSVLGLLGAAWGLRPCTMALAVRQGQFHSVAHLSRGTATLYKRNSGEYVLRIRDLETARRPDLMVYLTDAADAQDNDTVAMARWLVVGPLRGPGRTWLFSIPAGVNVPSYRSVTIWSAKYGVNFTTAPLVQGGDRGCFD